MAQPDGTDDLVESECLAHPMAQSMEQPMAQWNKHSWNRRLDLVDCWVPGAAYDATDDATDGETAQPIVEQTVW